MIIIVYYEHETSTSGMPRLLSKIVTIKSFEIEKKQIIYMIILKNFSIIQSIECMGRGEFELLDKLSKNKIISLILDLLTSNLGQIPLIFTHFTRFFIVFLLYFCKIFRMPYHILHIVIFLFLSQYTEVFNMV